MWFTSTANPQSRIDCRTAMLSAYAPDGGLLLPVNIPKLTTAELQKLANFSYIKLLANLFSRFLDPETFNQPKLEELLADIPEMFACKDEMIPVREICLSDSVNVSIAELFHGPSLAFKDLATIPSCRLMDAALADSKDGQPRRGLVVVSTSGDTGASVAGAVETTKRLDALVLLPGAGRVAKIQERQTITWPGDNVHVFTGDASSDDLDVLAGKMQDGSPLCDQELLAAAKAKGLLLTSLNSLNPIRILSQLAPFFYIYLKKCPQADRKVCFILPTGGAGNLSAGLLARRMGLPIEFVVALNANASFPQLIQHFENAEKRNDVYDVPSSIRTLAPAMDMGFPYNFPRIAYLASCEQEKPAVKFSADPQTGHQKVEMSAQVFQKVRDSLHGISAANDAEIEEAMRLVASRNSGYAVCPHTATAISAAKKLFSNSPVDEFAGVVVMATASPAKFVEALERADLYEGNDEIKQVMSKLESMPVRAHYLPKKDSSLKVPYDEWFGLISEYVKSKVFAKAN